MDVIVKTSQTEISNKHVSTCIQARILTFSVRGVGGLARGVGNFSPLTLLTRHRCAAPRLRQAIADCRTFLKFNFFICLGI